MQILQGGFLLNNAYINIYVLIDFIKIKRHFPIKKICQSFVDPKCSIIFFISSFQFCCNHLNGMFPLARSGPDSRVADPDPGALAGSGPVYIKWRLDPDPKFDQLRAASISVRIGIRVVFRGLDPVFHGGWMIFFFSKSWFGSDSTPPGSTTLPDSLQIRHQFSQTPWPSPSQISWSVRRMFKYIFSSYFFFWRFLFHYHYFRYADDKNLDMVELVKFVVR